jgi:hypothetical protein
MVLGTLDDAGKAENALADFAKVIRLIGVNLRATH